jgi:hypothetical protein
MVHPPPVDPGGSHCDRGGGVCVGEEYGSVWGEIMARPEGSYRSDPMSNIPEVSCANCLQFKIKKGVARCKYLEHGYRIGQTWELRKKLAHRSAWNQASWCAEYENMGEE